MRWRTKRVQSRQMESTCAVASVEQGTSSPVDRACGGRRGLAHTESQNSTASQQSSHGRPKLDKQDDLMKADCDSASADADSRGSRDVAENSTLLAATEPTMLHQNPHATPVSVTHRLTHEPKNPHCESCRAVNKRLLKSTVNALNVDANLAISFQDPKFVRREWERLRSSECWDSQRASWKDFDTSSASVEPCSSSQRSTCNKPEPAQGTPSDSESSAWSSDSQEDPDLCRICEV